VDDQRASVTAMGTALMRAIHTRVDPAPLIDDPWGELLLSEAEREAFRAAHGGGDLDVSMQRHPSYANVILRARYTEDALAAAVARGASQYVIVGAGLDSFALRRPSWARELRIFEVDHPATQTFKLGRLAEHGRAQQAGVTFVAADLGQTPLDFALAGTGFDRDRWSFFAWLGVTPYLTREANLATLGAIARSGAPGSELVFTYFDQRMFEDDEWPERTQRVRSAVAAAGEPWVSGLHPTELADVLGGIGLRLVENLGPAALAARYRTKELRPSAHSYIAHARIE
jgi:methyltransferase (TIGR00027 family)